MTEQTQTIKIRKKSLRLLRLIHAETEESLLAILHRVIEQDYRQITGIRDELERNQEKS